MPLPLGGAKQRAVLAVLLLAADEVVPVARLVDEVWGDVPPPSAAHSLEAYVSRLRQLLNGHEATLQRQGAGYRLRLDGATLDAQTFARLSEQASLAAAMGDDRGASDRAREAVELWRGPVLADVTLGSGGRADAERLEELRLRTYEQCFEADLALGRHDEIAGELRALVDQNPYRERFVAQLMLALYRSGRHVAALEVYERTRRALADDVGLQPSTELQQLSGRIVRQDPDLGAPDRPTPRRRGATAGNARPPRTSARRRSLGAFAGAAVAAAAVTLVAGGATSATSAPTTPTVRARVALVLPEAPNPAIVRDVTGAYAAGLDVQSLTGDPLLNVRTFVAGNEDPERVDEVAASLRSGGYGLVLWVGDGEAAQRILPTVRQLPETRFVFLDAAAETLGLAGLPNASAIRFAGEQTGELVGYLSGLVAPRRGPPGATVDTISYVGGIDTPAARAVAAALERGLKRLRPGGKVLVGFTDDEHDRTACEQLANQQIDEGADVVVADAGDCGIGALAVATTRGVWSVGNDGELIGPETWEATILATRYENPKDAVALAVRGYRDGTLPAGGEQVLGLEDDYAVGIEYVSTDVPEAVWSKVTGLCSDIRRHAPVQLEVGSASAAASAPTVSNTISPRSA